MGDSRRAASALLVALALAGTVAAAALGPFLIAIARRDVALDAVPANRLLLRGSTKPRSTDEIAPRCGQTRKTTTRGRTDP
jgi:hypothetical protein